MQGNKPGKGRVLMGMGLVLLAAALVLALRLIKEEHDAGVSAQNVLLQMTASAEPTEAASAEPTKAASAVPMATPSAQQSPETSVSPSATPLFTPQPEPTAAVTAVPQPPRRALFEINPEMEMPITVIDSNEYIGVLDFPVLGISLPVMSDWSYPQLKIAPCRYKGSAYTGDLIISAHNYERHFGCLANMFLGDEIRFTDVDGNVFFYTVIAKEQLDMRNVQGMLEGEWDMTLFTCVPGGAKRETLRCHLERYEVAGDME